MKRLLCVLLFAGCAGDTTREDNRIFNCSAEIVQQAISLDDFEQRVGEGENLSTVSSFEANGEQFVVINICTENTANSESDANTTTTTVNGLL